MRIPFVKYQGTGNDFILLDNRKKQVALTKSEIKHVCDRHFGIGADGLMYLEDDVHTHFAMVYFNSDGNESTMCGNGGRCITAYAKELGLVNDKATFKAIDGIHESLIPDSTWVELKMKDVHEIKIRETYFELNTGSPHYVHYSDYVNEMDVKKEGGLIRYSPLYKDEGINVNFVEVLQPNSLFVRTYERGVEDETLSCGTGVTAAAITHIHDLPGKHMIKIKTLGGELMVDVHNENKTYFHSIWLKGLAQKTFEGVIEL